MPSVYTAIYFNLSIGSPTSLSLSLSARKQDKKRTRVRNARLTTCVACVEIVQVVCKASLSPGWISIKTTGEILIFVVECICITVYELRFILRTRTLLINIVRSLWNVNGVYSSCTVSKSRVPSHTRATEGIARYVGQRVDCTSNVDVRSQSWRSRSLISVYFYGDDENEDVNTRKVENAITAYETLQTREKLHVG